MDLTFCYPRRGGGTVPSWPGASASASHPRVHGGNRTGPCGATIRRSLFKLLEPSPRSRGKPGGPLRALAPAEPFLSSSNHPRIHGGSRTGPCGTAYRLSLSAYLPGARANESKVSGTFIFFSPRYSVVKQVPGSRTLRASCDRKYAIERFPCQSLFLPNTLF